MTRKTKLEIIGPYTPEHEGPFCTRDGRPVRIVCTDRKVIGGDLPILCLVTSNTGCEVVYAFKEGGISHVDRNLDLMNAREVPVAREWYIFFGGIFDTKEKAMQRAGGDSPSITHVREVLPGGVA